VAILVINIPELRENVTKDEGVGKEQQSIGRQGERSRLLPISEILLSFNGKKYQM